MGFTPKFTGKMGNIFLAADTTKERYFYMDQLITKDEFYSFADDDEGIQNGELRLLSVDEPFTYYTEPEFEGMTVGEFREYLAKFDQNAVITTGNSRFINRGHEVDPAVAGNVMVDYLPHNSSKSNKQLILWADE